MSWQAAAILAGVVLVIAGVGVYVFHRATRRTAEAEAALAIERSKRLDAEVAKVRDQALERVQAMSKDELVAEAEAVAERLRKDFGL